MAGGFILLDLILDRYRGGFAAGWMHLILVVSALLISYILMSRAMNARKRAEAVLRQARDEMESQVHERTAELEQANQALRTSEETARALMNASSESALLLDAQGNILAANETAAQRLDAPIERLLGSSLFSFFPPEVAGRRRNYLDAILQTGQPVHFIDERSGRTYDSHVYPIHDADGRIVRLAAFGQDITDRLQAETALRQMNQRLVSTQDAAGAGSWDWDIPTGHLEWSAKMFELFGLDERTTAASFDAWRSALHPADQEVAEQQIAAALETHSELDNEYRVILPDGQIRWISALGRGIYDEQDRPIRMSGICLDITDRKRVEASIQHLSSFPQLNPNPVLEIDASGRITFVNPRAARTLEWLGLGDDTRAFLPADMATILQELEHKREGGFQREVQVGSAIFAETIQVIPASDVVRIYAFDITERKQAETAQRASEEKYRLLFQNMVEGFAVYELLYDEQGQPVDWRVLEVNDAYTRHTGVTRDRIVGRRISELFPAAIPEYLPRFAEVVATQIPSEFETYAKAVGRHQRVSTFPAGGHRFASIIEDITDRKRAEDALRASEEKFATVFRFSPDAIGIARAADGVFLDVNDAFTEILGYERSEVIGRTWRELRLIPATDEGINVAELFGAKGQVSDLELDLATRSGEVASILVSIMPIAISGEPCVLAIAHDITKRKQSEEALRQAQAELARASRNAARWKSGNAWRVSCTTRCRRRSTASRWGSNTALTLFDTDRTKSARSVELRSFVDPRRAHGNARPDFRAAARIAGDGRPGSCAHQASGSASRAPRHRSRAEPVR